MDDLEVEELEAYEQKSKQKIDESNNVAGTSKDVASSNKDKDEKPKSIPMYKLWQYATPSQILLVWYDPPTIN